MRLFNKNLTYIREKGGLSQKELASKIGVDQSSVSLWESGMDTTTENAVKISKIFNISLDKLINADLSLCSVNKLKVEKSLSKKEYDVLVKELLDLFLKLDGNQQIIIINLMKNMH